MLHFIGALLVSSLFAFAPFLTRDIGRAFAANDARSFTGLLSSSAGLHVSLPDPISFSDRVSREQSYFLLARIFSVHKTFEFVPEPDLSFVPGRPGFIFRARWSFRDTRNGNPYLFRVFFYIRPRPERPAGASPSFPEPPWEIVEIKAERL